MTDSPPADETPEAEPDHDPLAAERRVQAGFVAGEEDVEGLLAYALHRRASLEFIDEFRRRRGRAPEPGEIAAFETGETAPTRIAAYRAEAARRIAARAGGERGPEEARGGGAPPMSPPPAAPRSWPWFGLHPEGPPAGPVDWKGLALRLLVLLLAVIVTALFLRILVVRP